MPIDNAAPLGGSAACHSTRQRSCRGLLRVWQGGVSISSRRCLQVDWGLDSHSGRSDLIAYWLDAPGQGSWLAHGVCIACLPPSPHHHTQCGIRHQASASSCVPPSPRSVLHAGWHLQIASVEFNTRLRHPPVYPPLPVPFCTQGGTYRSPVWNSTPGFGILLCTPLSPFRSARRVAPTDRQCGIQHQASASSCVPPPRFCSARRVAPSDHQRT